MDSTGHRLSWYGLRDVAGVASARLVYGAIAQEREQDPGEPAREHDHRDTLAAPGADATRPLAQRRGPGIAKPEHRDGGLDEQPAHPARARFALGGPGSAVADSGRSRPRGQRPPAERPPPAPGQYCLRSTVLVVAIARVARRRRSSSRRWPRGAARLSGFTARPALDTLRQQRSWHARSRRLPWSRPT